MKKTLTYKILVTLFALSLVSTVGCTKIVGWTASGGSSHMSSHYASFTGIRTKDLTMKEGQKSLITYSSKVEKGALSIQVLDPNRTSIADLETNTSGSKEIKAEKAGTYQMVITGKEAGGNFDVKWEKK